MKNETPLTTDQKNDLFNSLDPRDQRIAIGDVIGILIYIFTVNPVTPSCLDSLDVDDSGFLELRDAELILAYLFGRGAPPLPPFPDPDIDPTTDTLPCE